MKINSSKLVKCLFGFHNYTVPHKTHSHILICKHCKRFGYCKYPNGYEYWSEYDEEGNEIHRKYPGGTEEWYNERGLLLHRKYSDGFEEWYGSEGRVPILVA